MSTSLIGIGAQRLPYTFIACFISATLSVAIYSGIQMSAVQPAMKIVETRIDIPEEYSKFNYNKFSTANGDCYKMVWQNKDNSEWIFVSVVGEVIIGYEFYMLDDFRCDEETNPDFGFADLSADTILTKAQEYLEMLNPETVTSQLEVQSNGLDINVSNACAQVNYQRVVDGINIEGDTAEVVVNKNTGELLAFGLTWTQDV